MYTFEEKFLVSDKIPTSFFLLSRFGIIISINFNSYACQRITFVVARVVLIMKMNCVEKKDKLCGLCGVILKISRAEQRQQ